MYISLRVMTVAVCLSIDSCFSLFLREIIVLKTIADSSLVVKNNFGKFVIRVIQKEK